MSFDVIFNYEIQTPVALGATDITDNSFRAIWTSESADTYTIELTKIKSIKPYVEDKIIIEDIMQTEYLVKDLDAVFCIYKVKAHKGNLYTEWSNLINVSLNTSNGIKDVMYQREDNNKIFSLNGTSLCKLRKGDIVIKNKKSLCINKVNSSNLCNCENFSKNLDNIK